eukprot:1744544-Pyramimonas_sp.AAC.1
MRVSGSISSCEAPREKNNSSTSVTPVANIHEDLSVDMMSVKFLHTFNGITVHLLNAHRRALSEVRQQMAKLAVPRGGIMMHERTSIPCLNRCALAKLARISPGSETSAK